MRPQKQRLTAATLAPSQERQKPSTELAWARMPQLADDLHTREERFGTTLNAHYPTLWPVTEAVLQFSQQVFGACPSKPLADLPDSELVSRNLMARIVSDLYALATLAWRGYTVQTAALAASTFESCYLLCYIGANDDTAAQWLNHPNDTTAFIPVFNTIQGTLRHEALGEVNSESLEQATRAEYRVYQLLCAMKHSNATFQLPLGVQWKGVGAEVHVGPQLTPQAQEATLWVMWNTLRLVLLSADTFARAHVPFTELRWFKLLLPELNRRMIELQGDLPGKVIP